MLTKLYSVAAFLICVVALTACAPLGTPEANATITPTVTPLPPPQALDLGTLGKGSAGSVDWSSDGKMLAVSSSAGGYVYDTTTWELIASIPTDALEDNRLSALRFFPDNQSLIFTSGFVADSTYRSVFWRYDLQSGKISRVFETIKDEARYAPLFSPDGKIFAFRAFSCVTSETDRTCAYRLELRDSITGALIRRIPEDGLEEWTAFDVLTFSPNSQWLASGGEDNVVRVWEISSGKLKYELQQDSDVSGISFSPDNSVLASTDKYSAARFWDMKSGESLYVLRGVADQLIQNAVYIEGGKKLLVNDYDGKFKQYSLDERYLPIAPLDVVMQTEEQFWEQAGRYRPDLIMRFSPDGRTMALIVNANAQIWDLPTGKKTLTLPEFNRGLLTLEFSPDGRILATADHNVHLWDVSSKKLLATLEVNVNQIMDIAFHPDGARVAFTGNGVEVWDLTQRRKIRALKPECLANDRLSSFGGNVAYSPDGNKLAFASACGIQLMDANTGAILKKFPNDIGEPKDITFSADGNLLFYVSGYGRRAWNVLTGEQLYSTKRVGEDAYHYGVALRPNLLATTRWTEPLYFFDPVSGKRLYEFPAGKGGANIALSQNGRILALDDHSKISLFDSTSGAEILSFKFYLPYTMAFSPDEKMFAARSYSENVHLWDISSALQYADQLPLQTATPNPALTPTAQPTSTPAPTLSISIPTAPSPPPESAVVDRVARMEKLGELGLGGARVIAWSPDGKRIALGGSPGAYVFDFGSAQPSRFLPASSVLLLLSFSPDGHYLAGQISNYEIEVWDVETETSVRKFENIYCWNQGMTFSPDNELLSARCGNITYTWNIFSGRLVSKETDETYSDDVSLNQNLTVQVWMKNARLINAKTGEIIKTFEIPGMAPALAKFTPDGKTLAVWHYQYEIARTGVYFPGQDYVSLLQLWNIFPDEEPTLRAELATGKWYLNTLTLEAFQGISFTSDSRKLATASGDDAIQIWDVNSGKLLYILPNGNNVYFSPNNKYLASLNPNGARIWDVSSSRQPAIVMDISGFSGYSSSMLFFTSSGAELVNVSGKAYQFFTRSGATLIEPPRQIKLPDDADAYSMSVSPDGRRLAYSTAEEIVIGENDPKNQNWQTLSKFAEPLTYERDLNLTFSPDGSLLASYDPDNKIRLWNLEKFESVELESANPAFVYVSEFIFSPDGTLLLGTDSHTSDASTLRLWDTRAGKLVRQWTSQIYQLAFHPTRPALVGADYMTGMIRLFDLQTGDMTHEFRADRSIRRIVFSPDGSLLALAYDNKVELRDAETGAPLKEIESRVNRIAFSPDGNLLVVGDWNGTIEYWGWR